MERQVREWHAGCAVVTRARFSRLGPAVAYRSIPLQRAYGGAEAVFQGYTDALRSELIHHGSRIRISMLQLPAVNTP